MVVPLSRRQRTLKASGTGFETRRTRQDLKRLHSKRLTELDAPGSFKKLESTPMPDKERTPKQKKKDVDAPSCGKDST
jgi:hypothetical protein